MEEFTDQQIQEHFLKLPKVLQDAITSADIEKRLREIADKYKLHLDQWSILEDQVMLALMGMHPAKELKDNIVRAAGIDETLAITIAADISRVVFDPVREEIERHLDHPEAQAKKETGIDKVVAHEIASDDTAPAPLSSPPAPPDAKAVRAPLSETYKPGVTSAARKDVVNDPYREPPL